LLGPSGSGKTTLLRIIAGLETADEGSIIFDGEDNTKKSAQDRKVGFVFQHYALFKHMTVFENIAFGLRVMPSKIRPNKEAIKNKVYELLNLVRWKSWQTVILRSCRRTAPENCPGKGIGGGAEGLASG